MNDPDGMRVGHGDAGLKEKVDRLVDRQNPPAFEPRSQVFALEIFHHDVRCAVVERAHVGDASHVIALDADHRPGFPRKASHGIVVRKPFGQENFECHFLVELDVPGEDDDTHPAHAEHPLDTVLSREHVALADAYGFTGIPLHHAFALQPCSGQQPSGSLGDSFNHRK